MREKLFLANTKIKETLKKKPPKVSRCGTDSQYHVEMGGTHVRWLVEGFNVDI